MLGARKLDNQEWKDWSRRYEEARNMLEGRDKAMEDLQEEIETDLDIVGATAIEDKLQDQVRKAEFKNKLR